MAREQTKTDLVEIVRAALHYADVAGEWGAAAHLNQALIALSGDGAIPQTASALWSNTSGKPAS